MGYRRNLPLLLLSVREQVRVHFQPVFREFAITEQQWRILRALFETPGLSVVEIADACCILRPSIVGIVARMVEIGLIERQPCPNDKRRAIVNLTTRGRQLVEDILPRFDTIYREIEGHVGKRRLDQLYKVLDDFRTHIATLEVAERD